MIMSTENDNPRGCEMRGCKDVAEAAGTTVDVVRERLHHRRGRACVPRLQPSDNAGR